MKEQTCSYMEAMTGPQSDCSNQDTSIFSNDDHDEAFSAPTNAQDDVPEYMQEACLEDGKVGKVLTQLEDMTISPPRGRSSSPLTNRANTVRISSPEARGTAPGLDERRTSILRYRNDPSTPRMDILQHSPERRQFQHFGNGSGPKHYDLTPVTRNTSSDSDVAVAAEFKSDDRANIISPDETSLLGGEILSFPTDFPSDISRKAVPAIPPLDGMNEIHRGIRSTSFSNLEKHQSAVSGLSGEYPLQEEIGNAVQLPPAGKFFSFTSRQDYEKDQENLTATLGNALKPYQPHREDFVGVGTLPQEALNSIFIARRRSSGGAQGGHGDLFNPIAMEERQWSIPSLRMANQLRGGGSTASITDEEDESTILHYRVGDDDASLSSKGSSIFLNEDEAAMSSDAMAQGLFRRSSSELSLTHYPPVMMNVDDSVPALQENHQMVITEPSIRRLCRQTKRSMMEREAYEWLRTVQAGNDVLAEAASSKFLTGNLDLTLPDGPPEKRSSANSTMVIDSAASIFSCPTIHGDRASSNIGRTIEMPSLEESTSHSWDVN